MALAALRPAPMAKITVAPPVTISPPAKMPSILVAMLFSSAMMLPHLLKARSGWFLMIGWEPLPMATTTTSTARPALSQECGLRRLVEIWLSQRHMNDAHAGERPCSLPKNSQWCSQELKLDTFMLGMFDFFEAAGISFRCGGRRCSHF